MIIYLKATMILVIISIIMVGYLLHLTCGDLKRAYRNQHKTHIKMFRRIIFLYNFVIWAQLMTIIALGAGLMQVN